MLLLSLFIYARLLEDGKIGSDKVIFYDGALKLLLIGVIFIFYDEIKNEI